MHIQNIYEERELERGATVKESLTVQQEGNRSVCRRVELYNLDVIISVGYRVKSVVATRFRIWATQRLREYIVKGFVLDDERLKNPDHKDMKGLQNHNLRDHKAPSGRSMVAVGFIPRIEASHPIHPSRTRRWGMLHHRSGE
jgi:hypothetical protein